MDELVKQLSDGTHPVEVSLWPEKTASALKKRIDEFGYIHIKFTGTRGGTELGVCLNRNESNIEASDFEHRDRIRLTGTLMLNYVPVKCIVEIELGTLTGTGRLEVLPGS